MDRNSTGILWVFDYYVALRKESVDRNNLNDQEVIVKDVALRKESVDRNPRWSNNNGMTAIVALRKESVDRNSFVSDSLPALKRRSPQGERG